MGAYEDRMEKEKAEFESYPEYESMSFESTKYPLIYRSLRDERYECKRYENIAECPNGRPVKLEMQSCGRLFISTYISHFELGEIAEKETKEILDRVKTVSKYFAYIVNIRPDMDDHPKADIEIFWKE